MLLLQRCQFIRLFVELLLQRVAYFSYGGQTVFQHILGRVHHHQQVVGGVAVRSAKEVGVVKLVALLLHTLHAECFAAHGVGEGAVRATDHSDVTLERNGGSRQTCAWDEGTVGGQAATGLHIAALRLGKGG